VDAKTLTEPHDAGTHARGRVARHSKTP
jgi:hypothetical protein